ncbi:MAG: DUF664 domain-containing protein [Acidimicrobiia bacterium]|nr:DUF664 domain-containing protein [Acidimicrobiia bacterium]
METKDILEDAFGRIRGLVYRVTDGLTPADLTYRPDADANSIGWLIWHLTRIQDHHVSDLAGRSQVWSEDGWPARFDLDPDPENVGFGHSSAEVAAVRPETPELLQEYHEVVHARTLEYLAGINPAELDRIVDTRWDPHVSAGVRLVSIIGDGLQHIGQAAYVRGLLERLD